jgi:hypothetical protein
MLLPARSYTTAINITAAFTAQIDIFELLAASGKPLVLLGFELGQISEVGDAQEEGLTLVLKRVTGAPTSGSGGGRRPSSPPCPTTPPPARPWKPGTPRNSLAAPQWT